ncbi:MAG: hypothetical protein WCH39_28220, partial [Schlesneria sp.]
MNHRHRDSANIAWQKNSELDLHARLTILKKRLRSGSNTGSFPTSPWSTEVAGSPPPACVQLAKKLQLTDIECEVLLLAAAIELDEEFYDLLAQCPQARGIPAATVSLACQLYGSSVWDAFSPNGTLRRLRLIEIQQSAGSPLIFSAIRVDERILNFLRGLNELDDRLLSVLQEWNPSARQIPLVKSLEQFASEIRERVAVGQGVQPVVQ